MYIDKERLRYPVAISSLLLTLSLLFAVDLYANNDVPVIGDIIPQGLLENEVACPDPEVEPQAERYFVFRSGFVTGAPSHISPWLESCAPEGTQGKPIWVRFTDFSGVSYMSEIPSRSDGRGWNLPPLDNLDQLIVEQMRSVNTFAASDPHPDRIWGKIEVQINGNWVRFDPGILSTGVNWPPPVELLDCIRHYNGPFRSDCGVDSPPTATATFVPITPTAVSTMTPVDLSRLFLSVVRRDEPGPIPTSTSTPTAVATPRPTAMPTVRPTETATPVSYEEAVFRSYDSETRTLVIDMQPGQKLMVGVAHLFGDSHNAAGTYSTLISLTDPNVTYDGKTAIISFGLPYRFWITVLNPDFTTSTVDYSTAQGIHMTGHTTESQYDALSGDTYPQNPLDFSAVTTVKLDQDEAYDHTQEMFNIVDLGWGSFGTRLVLPESALIGTQNWWMVVGEERHEIVFYEISPGVLAFSLDILGDENCYNFHLEVEYGDSTVLFYLPLNDLFGGTVENADLPTTDDVFCRPARASTSNTSPDQLFGSKQKKDYRFGSAAARNGYNPKGYSSKGF